MNPLATCLFINFVLRPILGKFAKLFCRKQKIKSKISWDFWMEKRL